MLAEVIRLKVFGEDAPESELACIIAEAQEYRLPAGAVIFKEEGDAREFLILIEGRCKVSRRDPNGGYVFKKMVEPPVFVGEMPLLSNIPTQVTVVAETDVRSLRLDEEAFWRVMSGCPHFRKTVVAEMGTRMAGIQQQQIQQEKLAMLGTMTAGLMHELNNPGAAARRAAQQLRSNLEQMHSVVRECTERRYSPEQIACLAQLQERALSVRRDRCLSSLEQTDAEEEMGLWLEEHSIPNAWEYAPVFVASDIGINNLNCLAAAFPGLELISPVDWVEASASSMQMVTLVEESVARVTELAQSVKSYAHEGQSGDQDVDINQSIHSTLVMMKHKMREKNIRLQKDFGAGMPKIHCVCSGLNQVWTNLLDNAIDAAPAQGGEIRIRTELVDGMVHVVIGDNGPGIPPEARERIFEPFFTTKPAGIGSGMGLGIVERILEGYQGSLTVESQPGRTEFTVHLPIESMSTR